jgi:hypothetical protein
MMGSRQLKFRGELYVIDEGNDTIVELSVDPDDRGFFKKMTSKKHTYPDYFRGVVTSLSQNAKWDKKSGNWKILSRDNYIMSNIEGEFTSHIRFDNQVFWEYSMFNFPKLRRMAFTLPSDSTFREDLIWLKKGDEETAQKFKVRLEEIQRKDKKLREANEKTSRKNSRL